MSANDKAQGGPAAETKRPIRDGVDDARTHVADVANSTAARVKDVASDVVTAGRDTASAARSAAHDGFSGGIEGNPLLALAGGIAVGAIIGAVLPRSEREAAVLGAIGSRLIEAAHDAVDAARVTGRDKLDEAGLSRNGARDAVRGILDAALSAAFSAGSAAADAAKHKVVEPRD